MRIGLFESGLIGDLQIDSADVSIQKAGSAKYVFSIQSLGGLTEFELWTAKIGQIDFEFVQNEIPEWVIIEESEGQITSVLASNCSVHVEHCDRGVYSIVFSKGGINFGGSRTTKGYIKTKITRSSVKAHD